LAAAEVSCVRTPGAAAIFESRLAAALAITSGRPWVCKSVNPPFRRRASSASRPTSTCTPCARSSSKPWPQTRGFGSGIAATTRLMPAAMMRLVQGPVRPVWQHGSRLTNIVAPRARSPASSIAKISACGRPARGWRPCPTTMPSGDTITAPTIGFGVVTPSLRAAWNNARRMKSASVTVSPGRYHFSVKMAST
jgi:hypothetical protein